jgi:hypothetical protein
MKRGESVPSEWECLWFAERLLIHWTSDGIGVLLEVLFPFVVDRGERERVVL